ncbi:MAG: hypothetical protein Q8O03_08165 [Nanoarchaeota archaeon]|nr:hypothetical protein [Nanoarchaeota archaeon]
MKNKSILEKELENLKQQGKVYHVSISDLVMMQMVGDFESFVQSFDKDPDENKNFKLANKIIKDTKEHATTAKLFPSIIDKTIQAQVGERHAALRELGQNGMDAYECSDIKKPVVFDISKQEENLVLRVRDYGCGMDLKCLIKNLLVPYNSGKEFDITKIGEHGIGWYSIMDLAQVVKVVTKPKDCDKSVQALVYNKKGKWMSSILLKSDAGFSEDLNKELHGTEVIAYIPETKTNEMDIRNFLFQYLCMVDKNCAQIILGKELVNSVRGEYGSEVAVPVNIEGKEMPLILGASKRKLKNNDDNRFKHRDLNLEKILYTQNGLFVKYDHVPFESNSVHEKLMRDLALLGLDFWVDVPVHTTLTKGRNNIIAEHSMPVLDGMYQAFENLFLDVLLADEELLYHPSQVLLESISNLFKKSYSDTAELFEKRKYSLKRRLLSTGAAVGSKSLDIGVLVAKAVGGFAYKAVKYPFTSMPEDLKSVSKEDVLRVSRWLATRVAIPTGICLGLLYGGVELYKHYGSTPFIYMGCGLGAIGAAWFVRKIIKGYKDLPSEGTSAKEILSDVSDFTKACAMYLLNKCGLYVDVEKKREKKREEQRRKLSEKYLSKMKTDEFFKKVLNKKIIPAEFYCSGNNKEKEKKPKGLTLGEMFKNIVQGSELFSYTYDKTKDNFNEFANSCLNKTIVQLSIDDIIDLYLKGSLRHSKDSKKLTFSDGDYFVDYNNPITHTVISKLEQVTSQVKAKYDVKVLEDHIENILNFSKETGMALYAMSPIGILHLAGVLMFKSAKNPFKDYFFYQKTSGAAQLMIDCLKDYKEWLPVASGIAKGCVKIPYSIASTITKGTYNHLVIPSCKALNPVKYPAYAKSVARWYINKVEDRKRKKELVAQSEKATSEKDSDAKRGLLGRIMESLSDVYQNSIVNELFGYGVLSGDSFNNLSKGRLEHITQVVGVGKAYPDFMSMVEGLDGMVCKALDKEKFNIVMSYSASRDPKYNHNGFMLADKGKTLHVCLEKIYPLVCNSSEYHFKTDMKEDLLAMVGYTMLDALIHQRTHEGLKYYDHSMNTYDYGLHDKGFFDKKDELRRKVIDYLEKNELQLTHYVNKFFPAEDAKKPMYNITPDHLSRLVHMTRRRLMDEAWNKLDNKNLKI